MVEFDVVDLGPADHPTDGDHAPDFTRPLVNTEFWENVSLSTLYEDAPVLLLFHPMDGAFPATYLWNELRERDIDDRDRIQTVGLSISTPYAHKQLIESRDIDARLFSDPSNEVAEQYGIAHDLDGMAGISEPRPATFLIDEAGVIRHAWVGSEWPSFPDYDEIEAAIEAL
ncbi:peroxiredoxin family protein [Halocatena pleomorpha]|uniref:Peroxiredoxin n=1 Tax=Halocatena pleomorpha TaxID=1785090 RepID=A0A3P3RA43_9EURY|nr:redoxin domain-containing protein [Halocatena pleomorpha]RRJ30351.1 peroxiredoxin [Halocatena pleomorpha]